MTSTPTMYWRTTWSNGSPTYWITFVDVADDQRRAIERVADDLGFQRDGGRWEPAGDNEISSLFQVARAQGVTIDFGKEDQDAPFDLQRLKLDHNTRWRLEKLAGFVLFDLAGYCPVQASGVVDQSYWYFRARGAYWRFEAGGNEIGTKGPTWWHGEEWPGETGFEAGYMSDEDVISCIWKSVRAYRTEDRRRFERGHHDFERTTLEGWTMGALSLQRAVRRLGISGEEALARATAYGLDLPFLATRELSFLQDDPTVLVLDETSGTLIEVPDEDDV